jgi:DNA-binding transcriptional MerR regulator
MQELERLSGVGRETIRYYIRMGLLPEPTRPKPNVANYDDEHLRRLAVIRRLQQQRYLPLSFIKTLLDRPTHGELAAFPGLEGRLAEDLALPSLEPVIPLPEAATLSGLTVEELSRMMLDGILAQGLGLSHYDLAIAQTWKRAKDQGYDEATGFFPEDLAIYVEALAPLARREVDRFYERISGAADPDEAARLGRQGIELLNELIVRLRTRLILERVAELNREGPAGSD